MNQIEQLEYEAERARVELASSLDALRNKLTPDEIVHEGADYFRGTQAGQFVQKTSQNTLPFVAPLTGVAWVCMATALRSQRRRAKRESATSTMSEAPGSAPDLFVAHEGWGVERVR